MQVHQLKLNNKRKEKKSLGRGGKKGIYSGRGVKGQKARSGAHVDPIFEGGRSSLIDRMKKKRGFKSVNPKKVAIKFSDISKKFENGAKITLEGLVKNDLIKKTELYRGVKIIGPKIKDKNFTFDKNIPTSASIKK